MVEVAQMGLGRAVVGGFRVRLPSQRNTKAALRTLPSRYLLRYPKFALLLGKCTLEISYLHLVLQG